MLAHAIVIRDHEVSEFGYSNLVQSSHDVGNDFEVNRFTAITPNQVLDLLDDESLKWNYPWEGRQIDFQSGLIKTAYATKNPNARIACALSHYMLWKKSLEMDETILILEHDAKFIKKIDFDPNETTFGAIGINDPRGATRLSNVFYQKVKDNDSKFQVTPYVDSDLKIPQGLAGNSAYILKPSMASELINAVKHYGLWPNDALMCRQLFTGELGVTRVFYTTIQKLESTTVN